MTANTLDGHEKSIEDIALEVIAGKWGTGDELRKNLAPAQGVHPNAHPNNYTTS